MHATQHHRPGRLTTAPPYLPTTTPLYSSHQHCVTTECDKLKKRTTSGGKTPTPTSFRCARRRLLDSMQSMQPGHPTPHLGGPCMHAQLPLLPTGGGAKGENQRQQRRGGGGPNVAKAHQRDALQQPYIPTYLPANSRHTRASHNHSYMFPDTAIPGACRRAHSTHNPQPTPAMLQWHCARTAEIRRNARRHPTATQPTNNLRSNNCRPAHGTRPCT